MVENHGLKGANTEEIDFVLLILEGEIDYVFDVADATVNYKLILKFDDLSALLVQFFVYVFLLDFCNCAKGLLGNGEAGGFQKLI